MKKELSPYAFVALIFFLIRQYLMPNPFDVLGEGVILSIFGSSRLFTPTELNFYTEPIMHGFTYVVVKLYYEKGSFPVLGSVLYMLFYWIHTLLLRFVLMAYPTTWLMILILVAYFALHLMIIDFINNRNCM